MLTLRYFSIDCSEIERLPLLEIHLVRNSFSIPARLERSTCVFTGFESLSSSWAVHSRILFSKALLTIDLTHPTEIDLQFGATFPKTELTSSRPPTDFVYLVFSFLRISNFWTIGEKHTPSSHQYRMLFFNLGSVAQDSGFQIVHVGSVPRKGKRGFDKNCGSLKWNVLPRRPKNNCISELESTTYPLTLYFNRPR